mmetsp:Transcript_17212/g.45609  ORF Transcript_17212/g.45609 Transcript_17212/m.45609 type:complete len:229 (+) Transcript_17212:2-688(+)
MGFIMAIIGFIMPIAIIGFAMGMPGADSAASPSASWFCIAPTCAATVRYFSDHFSSRCSSLGSSSSECPLDFDSLAACFASASLCWFCCALKAAPPCGLTATHLLSIMWLAFASMTLSTASRSTNLMKAKPRDVPSGSRLMSTLSTWPNFAKCAATLSSVVLFLSPPTNMVVSFSSFSFLGPLPPPPPSPPVLKAAPSRPVSRVAAGSRAAEAGLPASAVRPRAASRE